MMYSRSRVLYGSARAGASLLWSRSPLYVFEAKCFWVAASLTLVILSAAAATGAQLELRQVAFSGEMPPGASTDINIRGFAGAPVIDDEGQVAFLAELGPGLGAPSLWFDS